MLKIPHLLKLALLPLVLLAGVSAHADEIILTGDGSKIRLNNDGTWQRVDNNIYLDTKEGKRVVLTPDGNWRYQGLAPEVSTEHYRELLVQVSMVSGLITETREKVGSSKNYRTETTTRLTLKVGVAATARQPLALNNLTAANIRVFDKRGKAFPVTAVEVEPASVAPGGSAEFSITCEGAPSVFARSKTLVVTIEQAAVGTADDVQLEIDYEKMERKRINL